MGAVGVHMGAPGDIMVVPGGKWIIVGYFFFGGVGGGFGAGYLRGNEGICSLYFLKLVLVVSHPSSIPLGLWLSVLNHPNSCNVVFWDGRGVWGVVVFGDGVF